MKRIIFLALVLAAHPVFAINGNQWLDQIQSTDTSKSVPAFTHLAGIFDTLLYSGLANLCPDIPDGVSTEQVRAILIKWFEDNPQNRHKSMPFTTWQALGDANGFVSTDDDGICPVE